MSNQSIGPTLHYIALLCCTDSFNKLMRGMGKWTYARENTNLIKFIILEGQAMT